MDKPVQANFHHACMYKPNKPYVSNPNSFQVCVGHGALLGLSMHEKCKMKT